MVGVDFLMISTRATKRNVVEVYPRFIITDSTDLMIRGGDFYAIWIEEKGLWSTNEQDALRLIDSLLDQFAKENAANFNYPLQVMHMWDAETRMIEKWHTYVKKDMRDNFHVLDEKLIFSNTATKKEDYASRRLPYPLEEAETPSYEKLISTLYLPEERHKIEWSIGSIVAGDSKRLQKFLVLYGAAGTGKSTILSIIQQLFEGYYSVFDAKALGSSNNSFALEAFKSNPLVAIQHDGDLSKIEDNTRLNSLVSHELMTVNEKFKSTYASRFKCFLFMGTNKPVKITDGRSGLIRRLIDVSPSGNKLKPSEYDRLTKQIAFELGGIADRCLNVYKEDPRAYDNYIPVSMLGASNDFYNFIIDSYHIFKRDDGVSLSVAWEMYQAYCDDAKVGYPFSKRIFKEELKNYFRDYSERISLDDGSRVRSWYSGFCTEKFEELDEPKKESKTDIYTIDFSHTTSIFDFECCDCLAQYANEKETPTKKWEKITTTLSQLDTSKLHYVKVPENHIVIDFDIPDESGNKCFALNLQEASKFPPTYAELSKSGQGIHLHYIYTGDVSKLSKIYKDHVEIKVFNGNSSLRRKLSKCNNLPIATINSGLPLKGEQKVINFEGLKSEKSLRTQIKRNLNKEIHPGTKPSIDFIYKILEDAYNSDLKYDVSDMKNDIYAFAANSTHQSDYCIKLVSKMKFKSEDPSVDISQESTEEPPIVFYDVEVFPNLFLVNWKIRGEGKKIVRMINPSAEDIESLLKYRLIGFNCRRYDNHILYARLIGYSNEELFDLSQRIVAGSRNAFFGEAYNLSYTDIYDFASAGHKQSLKKFEIELGLHHQELGLPWDQPVPEDKWLEVAAYCDNDVISTEKTFDYLSADWTARQILAKLAGMSVNDTTNSLTTRIIFGSERKPQSAFNYRDLSQPVKFLPFETIEFLTKACPEMMAQKHGEEQSFLPYFPGYVYDHGKSTYKGVEVGEGGRVFSIPGMYVNVALLDIASMHPHSTIAEVLFGVKFTQRFQEIVEGRVSIKHEAWAEVNAMMNGALTPFVQMVIDGLMTSDQLADALKTAINSVYGLTAANFDNAFRDTRNIDNIVAKRGALFMIDLTEAVQQRGFTVAHIKTDSIKIPNATLDVIRFVQDFGKRYGYTFEHEATYDRMCLVNDAVYIAKYATIERCYELYGENYVTSSKDICKKNKKKGGKWDATGAQFAVPYVFKSLFSKEPIEFQDKCETKSVATALYLDLNEGLEPDNHAYQFVGKIGQFCPIKPGCHGGELMRQSVDKKTGDVKYDSATGAKGYRWLESEYVKQSGKENDIDDSYYRALADAAIDTIQKYGDYEWFVSDEDVSSVYDNPPWCMACGKDSCITCPYLKKEPTGMLCAKGFDNSDFIKLNSKEI